MQVVNFVIGIIGEQSIVRIFPSRSTGAIAGDKHPEIRAADQIHEKQRHVVIVTDLVKFFTVQMDILASNRTFIVFKMRCAYIKNWIFQVKFLPFVFKKSEIRLLVFCHIHWLNIQSCFFRSKMK
jgi:hypothetical protein